MEVKYFAVVEDGIDVVLEDRIIPLTHDAPLEELRDKSPDVFCSWSFDDYLEMQGVESREKTCSLIETPVEG